jgi:adenylate cyclase, class 2
MANAEQEIEVKLMVRSLAVLKERLLAQGASLVSARVHETNLRFDTRSGDLSRNRKALRLRKDTVSRLTFKGPQQAGEGASIRQEIEFEVSDFFAARRFLEALGFTVNVIYEKYRTTYRLGEVLVTLDEMPYGSFVEIEGASTEEAGTNAGMVDTLKSTAAALGLNWEARSSDSYLALFERLRQMRRLSIHDLTFGDLQGIEVGPEDLGLRFADY